MNKFKLDKRLIFYWLLLAFFLVGAFRLSQSRSLSFHFVDEEDHMVFASYMNQGFKLYQDLSSNHQPLVYLGSALVQKITQPENIFMLVKKHRQAIFFYAALWSFLLVARFRLLGLVLVGLFEVLKYYLFGNLFLMESLAVYPAIYLFGVMIEMVLTNKLVGSWESVFLGLCSFLIIFNLVPLWPWLGLAWLVFWFKNKKNFVWQITALILATAILFALIPPLGWFKETVWNNFVYAVPRLSPIKSLTDWLRLIFFPFLALFSRNSLQSAWIRIFFSGWLITFLYLTLKKDKKAFWLGSGYIFLLLANNRVLSPKAVFYQGFHLLPWLGLLIMLFLFSLKLWPTRHKKAPWLILLMAGWSLPLLLNQSMPYFGKTNIEQEYYVNYSNFDDFNWAVKSLSQTGDRLAVLTNDSLIYWQSGTVPASRQIVYYAWEHAVPDLEKDYKKVFSQNPPEFIYGGHEAGLVKKEYIRVFKNGQATELFIRKDKLENITKEQWNQAARRGFEINYL
jgi:hypothetical protein